MSIASVSQREHNKRFQISKTQLRQQRHLRACFICGLVILVLISLSSLTACGDDKVFQDTVMPASSHSTETTLSHISSDEDFWRWLVGGGGFLGTFAPSRPIEDIACALEDQKRRIRTNGLRYWSDHPDDIRNYRWLGVTIHLPPDNIDDCAVLARLLRGDRQLIVEDETSEDEQWANAYRSLKAKLEYDSRVSSELRRFIALGEIINTRTMRGVSATPDKLEIMAKVREFYSNYAKPLKNPVMGLDSSQITALSHLSRWVFFENAFQLDERELVELSDVFAKLSPSEAEYLTSFVYNQKSTLANRRPVPRLSDPLSLGYATPAFYEHDYELLVRSYHQVAQQVVDRSAGVVYWETMTVADRLAWLEAILERPLPLPTLRISDGMLLSSWAERYSSQMMDYNVTEKAELLDEWPAVVATLLKELSDAGVPTKRMNDLLGRFSWTLLAIAQLEYNLFGSDEKLRQSFDHIKTVLQHDPENYFALRTLEAIGNTRHVYGISRTAWREELKRLENAQSTGVEEMLEGLVRLDRLSSVPFEFQAKRLNGGAFDVTDMRGVIVLVDHWATSCASCIAAMPRIQDIYEDYKNKGFDVVSIAYDGTSKRKLVERIEKELGLTWTTLDGEGQWEDISEKYGYQGFPQYMLLNRNGTLHADTNEVDMGRNLEALLDEMLATEAAEKETATVH